MAAPATVSLPILDIVPETPNTQTYRLKASFPYKAGQSICLEIPGDPKKRFYSLSSSPSEKGYIAVTIKVGDPGEKLFDSVFKLNKGTTVNVTGPYGSMTLTDPLQGPFYFLAAGSGVTPFRAMVKYIADVQPATETWLLHSVRVPDDLIFKEEFLTWSKAPTFHYIPTFTRWNETGYEGETGRIGETLLRKHLDLGKGIFYICGPKEFVRDMEHTLKAMSVSPERIRREQW